jgi:hypothetical protein
MSAIYEWFFPTEPISPQIPEPPVKTAFEILQDILKPIKITQIDERTITFAHDNTYFVMSSIPIWNADTKTIHYGFYINELFWPQRRNVKGFVEWINSLMVKYQESSSQDKFPNLSLYKIAKHNEIDGYICIGNSVEGVLSASVKIYADKELKLSLLKLLR